LRVCRLTPSASAAVEGIDASIETLAPALAFAGLRTCVCVHELISDNVLERESEKREREERERETLHIFI